MSNEGLNKKEQFIIYYNYLHNLYLIPLILQFFCPSFLYFSENIRLQNILIFAASYFFYGWWDWRFLSLIFFSTVVDYTIGRTLATTEAARKRKMLLGISVVVNLGLLGFFKYFNFFLDNFSSVFSFFGYELGGSLLTIVLPVGISFYTFQTLRTCLKIKASKV